MAVDNLNIGYLLDPVFQIENINGKPLIGGYMEVYLAGTNTKYITFQDFDGTHNPFQIPLKVDGRQVVLAQVSNAYDVYVYDSYRNLITSRLNVRPSIGDENVTINGYYTNIRNEDKTLKVTLSGSLTGKNDYVIDTNHKPLGVESPLYWSQDDENGSVIALDVHSVTGDLVTKEYVDSKVSGKMDESKLGFDNNNKITGYNGSAFKAGSTLTPGQYIKINNDVISVTGVDPNSYASKEALDQEIDTRITVVHNIENAISDITSDVNTLFNNKQDKLSNSQLSAISSVSSKQDKLSNSQLSAISSVSSKQDKLTAGDHIEIKNNVISVTGEMGKTYTAGANINISNNNVISGKDWTNEINNAVKDKQDKLSNEQLSAISSVSSKADKSEIPSLDGYLKGSDLSLNGGNLIDKISGYSLYANRAYRDTNGNLIVNTYATKTELGDKLDTTAFSEVSGNFLTAHQSLSNYYKKTETSSSNQITNALNNKQNKLTFNYNTGNEITGINSSAIAGTNVQDTVGLINGEGIKFVNVEEGIEISVTGKQNSLTNAQLSAISSVSSKQDKLTDYTPLRWNTVTGKQNKLSDTQINKIDNAVTSLEGYATESWVENKNYLVSDDISGKQDKLSFTYIEV